MIVESAPWATEALSFLAWSACCFIVGVGWAAYRAVSWVERIRTWAANECSPVITNAESENV